MITPSFQTLTVTQLNKYVRSVIDGDNNLKSVFVLGEISNLKCNSFSGHMYFTLKDDNAAIKAVMFRSFAERLKFLPAEGMKVIVSGSVSVYERDGVYQLYVNDMQPQGVGSIALAFEQLKQKLSNEGLFDKSRKKTLPAFPKKIAVITSSTGAAVHDMMNVISRRWPVAVLVMCPVSVQGSEAPAQMITALKQVNEYTDCDVVIIGRGGGSIEDLWCFNDELLARTIADSKIPVISAVGHETDFTICDFVADMRAPTPSAAAEIAVPDISEIYSFVIGAEQRIKLASANIINFKNEQLNKCITSKTLSDPYELLKVNFLKLDGLFNRLQLCFSKTSANAELQFAGLLSKLEALDPMKVLKRGYTVAQKDGVTVGFVTDIEIGDSIKLNFADGTAECTVTDIERKD